jgi:ABC-2 type transport system ATP-binding protein
MSEFGIEAKGLTRTYGEVTAVQDVDLIVKTGEFFGFLGANGAGKSTTIRMLCGLLAPTAGTVRVAGFDVARDPLAVKRQIGVMLEEPSLYERLTAAEFLEFAGRIHGLPQKDALRRTDDLLSLFDLEEARERPIADYSMGMRKKTALAAALIHRPAVLFLDEPFNGLDVASVWAISTSLEQYVAHGGTVFFSSHLMAIVEQLCSRVAILARGRLAAVGTVQQLRERAGGDHTLEEMFVTLSQTERVPPIPSWL